MIWIQTTQISGRMILMLDPLSQNQPYPINKPLYEESVAAGDIIIRNTLLG